MQCVLHCTLLRLLQLPVAACRSGTLRPCGMPLLARCILAVCRSGTLRPCGMPLLARCILAVCHFWHAASLQRALLRLLRPPVALCLIAATATSCRTVLSCGYCDILSHPCDPFGGSGGFWRSFAKQKRTAVRAGRAKNAKAPNEVWRLSHPPLF